MAKDIAIALGYKDPTNAIKLHCRWVVKHHLPHPQSKTKMIEGNFIPEGDIYRLIVNSKLPKAVEFETWVFDLVYCEMSYFCYGVEGSFVTGHCVVVLWQLFGYSCFDGGYKEVYE